jgi:DNA end-binding protein Ku
VHTIWKGAISFGLVNIPVKMYAATEEKDISLRYLHDKCGSPLTYVRKCPVCNEEVAWEEIRKGYEYEKGRFVLIDKEELEQLKTDSSREIQILDFVHLSEIDPIYFQKTYYLGPGDTGHGAYNLLMRALQNTGKIGIAKVTMRSKTTLAAIRIIDGCIAMETIFYPDEIRPVQQVPNLPERVEVSEKELAMAEMLIEQLTTPFDPGKYHDDYREQLMQLIETKMKGEEFKVAPEAPQTNVVDLMAALQASLEAVKPKLDPVAAADPGTANEPAGAATKKTAKGRSTRKKAADKVTS